FLYPEIKKTISDKINSRKILLEFIDPLIKSGDELIAKIHSLAKTDFREAYTSSILTSNSNLLIERIYLLYLFCSFWGRVSIIRSTTNFSSIAKSKKGNRFLKFIYTFESKKNRIISRASQRVIGDAMLHVNNGQLSLISFSEFTEELIKQHSNLLKLITPLEEIFINSNNKDVRQKILFFGVILQVFLDSFDSQHRISRNRNLYINKLSNKTKYELQKRLFVIYLPFIKNTFKYYK
ncbi:MAG TPA: hypothetical protein VN958_04330, partial [Chitinophagaceae bacterium]|nr:hypothetical protein [Chitinophagaceae bacterium]